MFDNPLIPGDPYMYDLKWIVEKLKEAISLYEPLNDKFDNLYDYVHDYFDNLDLSAEVRAIIDQMTADGFFDTLVNQIVTDSGTIESTTTAWLAANVNPVGSAVVIDNSLTIAGAAADAKKTGDIFNLVKAGNFQEFIEKINIVQGEYINGYYVGYDTGNIIASPTWGYYKKIPVQGGQYYNAKGSNWHIAFFTESNVYISGVANTTASFSAPANAAYLTYSMPISDNVDQYIIRSTDHELTYISNDNGYISQHLNLKADHFMDFFRIGRNLYNKHRTITGYSFSYSNGLSKIDTLSSYHFTPDYTPCKPNTLYSWNYPCIIAEYDDDHNCINCYNRTLLTDTRNITTSSNAKYLRFSISNNYWQNYICVEGANTANYEDFSFIERYPERIFTVKQDGSGDFTTIQDAVNNAPANAPIYVYDGTYSEHVNARYKPLRLIGAGKNVVLTYSGLDYYAPPLEIANGYISNITILATNTGSAGSRKAYCAHIDSDYSINGSLIFDNVTFKNEVHQAVGIGLKRNFTLKFINCHFESDDNTAFYAHDWETSESDKSNQILILDNCTFKTNSNYPAIRLQSQELATNAASITFKNCKAIRTGSGEIIEMILWNGRTLTNQSYLGSSDWELEEFSFNNFNNILNYN